MALRERMVRFSPSIAWTRHCLRNKRSSRLSNSIASDSLGSGKSWRCGHPSSKMASSFEFNTIGYFRHPLDGLHRLSISLCIDIGTRCQQEHTSTRLLIVEQRKDSIVFPCERFERHPVRRERRFASLLSRAWSFHGNMLSILSECMEVA